ncbi:MAG: TonB-dependent receptor [Caulobacter sp.]|nr:TonB-dependent receptor [Caulobacter sp.]
MSFTRASLFASISLLALPVAAPALAQNPTTVEEVIITATRRDTTVQDAPINIAAIGGDIIEAQGFSNLADIAAYVPGIHLVDQGGRDGNRIIVRGLNADPIGSSEGVGNGTGGMVATYLGEVPIVLDLKLNDMERVEILLGPQGTLYGAGTMAGAVRYIPKRPSFAGPELILRGETYGYKEADSASYDVGLTFNMPLSDSFAVRGSIDYLDDSGFIDYAYVVREIGVSNPDALTNPADIAANTKRVEDANTEETLSGRLGFRWQPIEAIDANLTWYFQNQKVGARQISSARVKTMPAPVGDYESALRVLEPNDRDNNLVALEVTADLGFATLTSATGLSKYKETGQRDQTDLLIGLEYSYELFPSFTAFTREDAEEESLNQEIRLVSKGDGPLSWIVGGFYNKSEGDAESREFTPGYAAFNGGVRPDNLEYYSVDRVKLTETAFFGEISYRFTDAWQVTLGARKYAYDLETSSAVDFPLYNSVFGGAGPDDITLNFEDGGQDDDGWLFKFNTSYDLTDDLLIYATISEGYRIGNSNGVAACPNPLPNNQIACGLPNEMAYFPDKTKNYELGIHSQWLDRRLTINGAIFLVEWSDPQVASATENGLIPITKNGEAAESVGAELDFRFKLTPDLTIRGNYSYARAELTETTLNLIPSIRPGDPAGSFFQNTIKYENGEAGDRLPGAPENQGSLYIEYSAPPIAGLNVDFAYGISAVGDVLTRTGGKGGGITLDGYTIADLSVKVSNDGWDATVYISNLWNTYAETGARSTPRHNQVVPDINGDPVYARSFYTSVLPPRTVGFRLTKRFGG